ncbi:MAG: thiamine phosphate synthase [Pseudomonadota bacterium]
MKKKKIKGLYAITPDGLSTELLLEKVREVIAGGARIIQYRNKSDDIAHRLWQADALAALAKAQDAVFIINDSIDLAWSTNADGVHLGKDDSDVAAARRRLPYKLIGVSCYGDLERAIEAEKLGADYVAFGSAFSSSTKPNASPVPLELYQEAVRRLSIPIVAIGGIKIDNAKQVIDTGVDAIAVISGLFEADNIRARAECFSQLFEIG